MENRQSRTINSIKNIATGIIGQFLSIILKFVVRTVFIHSLGKQYLGINGLFSDILTMLSLTELGFDTAINFKLYKPLADKDEKRIRILMKFYKYAYRVVGAVILVAGIVLIPLLPRLIRDYDSLGSLGINATVIFLLYILKSVSSYLFFAYCSAIMKADQKKYILDLVDFVITIIDNIVQMLVLVIFKNFVLYTAILIIFSILRNLVNAIIAKKYYPYVFEHEEDSLSKTEIIGMLKDCWALFIYKLNGVVAKATDNMVISAYIGLSSVGLYSNYLLFYTTINGFLDKLYVAVKASMGNLFAVGDLEKKYNFFKVMNFLSIVLFGTAAVGVSICANELVNVWVGKDYVIPNFFSLLIGIEILLHGLTMNLEQIRNVTGVFRQMWYRPLLSCIINISLSIILIQKIGIHGVIIGTIMSSLLTNMSFDPYIIHKYSFVNHERVSKYYFRNAIYILVLLVIGLLNYYLCNVILVGKGWLFVIVHIIIIAIDVPLTYLILFWKTYECQYCMNVLKSISNKLVKHNYA